MVWKKDGCWRPCGYYRRLNNVTIPDWYPLPNILDFTSCLDNSSVFFPNWIPRKDTTRFLCLPLTSRRLPSSLHLVCLSFSGFLLAWEMQTKHSKNDGADFWRPPFLFCLCGWHFGFLQEHQFPCFSPVSSSWALLATWATKCEFAASEMNSLAIESLLWVGHLWAHWCHQEFSSSLR